MNEHEGRPGDEHGGLVEREPTGVGLGGRVILPVLAGDLEDGLGEAEGFEEHAEEAEEPRGGRRDPEHPLVVPPCAEGETAFQVLCESVRVVQDEDG